MTWRAPCRHSLRGAISPIGRLVAIVGEVVFSKTLFLSCHMSRHAGPDTRNGYSEPARACPLAGHKNVPSRPGARPGWPAGRRMEGRAPSPVEGAASAYWVPFGLQTDGRGQGSRPQSIASAGAGFLRAWQYSTRCERPVCPFWAVLGGLSGRRCRLEGRAPRPSKAPQAPIECRSAPGIASRPKFRPADYRSRQNKLTHATSRKLFDSPLNTVTRAPIVPQPAVAQAQTTVGQRL